MCRQKLTSFICFFALSFSVFFCTFSSVVLADDTDFADWDGYFSVYASPFMMVEFAAPNNLNGSTAYTCSFNGSTNVALTAHGFTQGHSYSGMAYVQVYFDRQYYDHSALYGRTNLYCTDVQTPNGITLAFMELLQNDAESTLCLGIVFYFDNYYHVAVENDLYMSFVVNVDQAVTTTSGGPITPYYFTRPSVDLEWIGTVSDTKLDVNPNISDVYYMGEQQMQQQQQISQQEMQQQQQIANQQSQQSAQQHEDLKNGFQDDTYNSNVSNAGNTVDSYISIESDLMQSQNQALSNYTDTAFDVNTMSPYLNAIAMCSTWYTWIWNAFGEFSVGFVVVLAVGVACLIIGIRKRG